MAAFFTDAHHAIRASNAFRRPVGVAYHQGIGWQIYDLTLGCPEGGEPQFLCFGRGTMPIPVSDQGQGIIRQLGEERLGSKPLIDANTIAKTTTAFAVVLVMLAAIVAFR